MLALFLRTTVSFVLFLPEALKEANSPPPGNPLYDEFMVFYFILYILDHKTAHKMVALFEEEAVKSYTEYLSLVENGEVENVPAPQLAIDYYNMNRDARLSDLIVRVRADEQHHSEVNHSYAASTSPRPVSKSEVVELAEN